MRNCGSYRCYALSGFAALGFFPERVLCLCVEDCSGELFFDGSGVDLQKHYLGRHRLV
jgi:hypothetical protein